MHLHYLDNVEEEADASHSQDYIAPLTVRAEASNSRVRSLISRPNSATYY